MQVRFGVGSDGFHLSASISARNAGGRAFPAETGQSPAKVIETLRVEGARNLMEHSRHPIDVVDRQTGFSDRDHMRRAFVRAFGQPPQALRRFARLEMTSIAEVPGGMA